MNRVYIVIRIFCCCWQIYPVLYKKFILEDLLFVGGAAAAGNQNATSQEPEPEKGETLRLGCKEV